MRLQKCCLVGLFLLFFASLMAQSIDRVEPPFWWTDMKSPELQLMIYGQGIAQLRPVINEPGIEIQQIRRVENPNYLFVDLRLSAKADAGIFFINFLRGNRVVLRQEYELKRRSRPAETVKGFDNSDVLYLITPDRFVNGDPTNDSVVGFREKNNRALKGGRHGGDMAGIYQSLDYIQRMGFTAIWMNPLLENDMKAYSYHGYSTTDFYKVDPRFGSNEFYRRLVNKARDRGIGTIMDMIVNHCGLYHWWMEDLPTLDWINTWEEYTQTNHQKTVLQDPYASDIDQKTFTDGWFVPTMPDLNQRNPLMATYLIQNSIWWIEYLGLAGIRMDTYPYPDMDFMSEWTRRVMEEYPNFNVVGEEWHLEPSIVAYWQKGKENPNGYESDLESLMDFPLQASLVEALNGPEEWGSGWIKLYEQLAQDFIYADPYQLVTFPDNHDMSRFFTQVNEDFDLWKLGMVFTLTTRGIPQIYYGTEILMTNPGTTDHGIIRSDFPGGWEGDQVNAFTGDGLTDQQKEAQDFLRKLLHWRQSAPAIHFGKLIHFRPENGVYVYFRLNERDQYMILLNKNAETISLPLNRFKEQLGQASWGTDIISGQTLKLDENNLLIPKRQALILKMR